MNTVTDFELGQEIYGITKKGKIKVWSCEVWMDDDDRTAVMALVNRNSLNGKEITRHYLFDVGKNIGKANETTPYEQACSEAESRYRKQFDKGYTIEIPDPATAVKANALGLPQPMLAKPCKGKRWPRTIGDAWVQPKLDGHRAVVTRVDGEIVMYSRQGKRITSMEHICKWVNLACRLDEGEFLDGELYIHGEHLQDIGSLIKKKQEGSAKVLYCIYDTFSTKGDMFVSGLDRTFSERYEILRLMQSMWAEVMVSSTAWRHVTPYLDNPLSLVETRHVDPDSEWSLEEIARGYVEKGYEGAIIRLDTKYEPGFRSDGLLKVKLFDDNEYKIIDVVEGKDRKVNDVDLKVACFICEMEDGKTFEAVSFGDMYEKDRIWHDRAKYMGKTVTIKHSGFTKDGIPWHPVALRIREDI